MRLVACPYGGPEPLYLTVLEIPMPRRLGEDRLQQPLDAPAPTGRTAFLLGGVILHGFGDLEVLSALGAVVVVDARKS